MVLAAATASAALLVATRGLNYKYLHDTITPNLTLQQTLQSTEQSAAQFWHRESTLHCRCNQTHLQCAVSS
jgi:hypothetical protein